jgi:hypothetical protein
MPANTGAPWNIVFAEPSDLVRDWPSLSEDVAESVADGLSGTGSVRTGTDGSELQVDDDGQINVADATSPSPIVRPLPFAMQTGTVTTNLTGPGSLATTFTFSSGRFTSTPTVVVGKHLTTTSVTVAAEMECFAVEGTVTSSGFTLRQTYDGGLAAVQIRGDWIAMQLEA